MYKQQYIETMTKDFLEKNIQNSTAVKKAQGPRRAKKKQSSYESGAYKIKYAADFLFMPWPVNKHFLDKLAEDYLNWAVTLAHKINTNEIDPKNTWHSLTKRQFLYENGIPSATFALWLKREDAEMLRVAHEEVIGILGCLREAAALWDRGNASHIRNTLGQYSEEYRKEREWLSRLSPSEDGEKSRSTIIVNIPEVRSESGNSDMAQ